jgi:hypothetical protein
LRKQLKKHVTAVEKNIEMEVLQGFLNCRWSKKGSTICNVSLFVNKMEHTTMVVD